MGDNQGLQGSIDANLARAARLAEKGELAEAFGLYRELAEYASERHEGFLGAAHCAYGLGHAAIALQLLPEVLKRQPDCLDAYQMLAVMGIQGGVTDKAIVYLEYGAQGMPHEPAIFEWLVQLYAMEGRTADLQSCLAHYARLREKRPTDVAMMFAREPTLPEDVRRRIAAAGRG